MPESRYIYAIISVLLAILLLLAKYLIYKTLRSPKHRQGFLKTFKRWYSREERRAKKLHISRKKYMLYNNWINLLFWLMYALSLILILYCFFEWIVAL